MNFFEQQLLKHMKKCFQGGILGSSSREKVWGCYHRLRVSEAYTSFWKTFLGLAGCSHTDDPILLQYLSHVIFKRVVKDHHPIDASEARTLEVDVSLTFEEQNVVRYVELYMKYSMFS